MLPPHHISILSIPPFHYNRSHRRPVPSRRLTLRAPPVPRPPETLITPEQFAEVLCDDLDLNPMVFVTAVAQSIRHQLDTYPTETVTEEASDQRVVIKVRSGGARAGHERGRPAVYSGGGAVRDAQACRLLNDCWFGITGSRSR